MFGPGGSMTRLELPAVVRLSELRSAGWPEDVSRSTGQGWRSSAGSAERSCRPRGLRCAGPGPHCAGASAQPHKAPRGRGLPSARRLRGHGGGQGASSARRQGERARLRALRHLPAPPRVRDRSAAASERWRGRGSAVLPGGRSVFSPCVSCSFRFSR